MSAPISDLGTDAAWEEWGRRDPYYGVITHPKFRRDAITEQDRREFFESGQAHVDHVMRVIRSCINSAFAPNSILDFGCGVGRIVIPFAALGSETVGLDVSASMLQEARRNCDERQLTNVGLVLSDDALSSLTGQFDLIHSFIVFQHIPPQRGKAIFANLLAHLAPGGAAAVHFGYAKRPLRIAPVDEPAPPIAEPPQPVVEPAQTIVDPSSAATPPADPEMQMNLYTVNELFCVMQDRGVHQFHVEFTDHGGELGIFLFFGVP
jgi:SAM-dependent methyltransferase